MTRWSTTPSCAPGRVYWCTSVELEITVNFCHQHNLVAPEKAGTESRFGIRVSLPNTDTFNALLGDDWERVHWYTSEGQRDRAYDSMAKRHGYYRFTDTPTQVLIKIVR